MIDWMAYKISNQNCLCDRYSGGAPLLYYTLGACSIESILNNNVNRTPSFWNIFDKKLLQWLHDKIHTELKRSEEMSISFITMNWNTKWNWRRMECDEFILNEMRRILFCFFFFRINCCTIHKRVISTWKLNMIKINWLLGLVPMIEGKR